MIFNICYKNRGNVLLTVDVYMKSEEFFNDEKKWRVELNTKIIGTGITRYVFETIKDYFSLRKFDIMEEIVGRDLLKDIDKDLLLKAIEKQ